MPILAKKILIVDDEPDILTLIENRLRVEGHTISKAQNGKQAFEKAKAESPDLIIADIMMPEWDGVDLYQAIKEEPATNDIPMIILTARGTTEEFFSKLHIDGFINKPFQTEELLAKVNEILNRPKVNTSPIKPKVQEEDEFEDGTPLFNKTAYDKFKTKFLPRPEDMMLYVVVGLVFVAMAFITILLLGLDNLKSMFSFSSTFYIYR